MVLDPGRPPGSRGRPDGAAPASRRRQPHPPPGRELERRGWRTVAERTNECPVIDLAGLDWEGHAASLGSSHRQNLRRRLRKLDRAFDVSFGLGRDRGRARRGLRHHARPPPRPLGRSGRFHAFPGPAVVAFHLASSPAWPSGAAGCGSTSCGSTGGRAAALYGFLYRGRFLFYQYGFDRAFADHSDGLTSPWAWPSARRSPKAPGSSTGSTATSPTSSCGCTGIMPVDPAGA